MSACVTIVDPQIASLALLLEGIKQLGLVAQEWRELSDHPGQKCKVDYVVQNEQGDQIGLRLNKNGPVEFIVENPEKKSVQETLGKVKQMYVRLKVIDEVKRKGYQQVKEEKLPNGSIRLVVQKWQ